MNQESLSEALGKKLDADEYIPMVTECEGGIPFLLNLIENDKGSVKFLCEKIIRRLSETQPEVLYTYFERLSKLINSPNSFIKYGFILTLPNLIPVDRERKWDKFIEQYTALLDTDSIAVFGNTVSSLWKVLDKYPEYEKIIVPKLLNIDGHRFLHHNEVSPECVQVAKGHILDFFDKIYPGSPYKKELLRFAENNVGNSRNKVRTKAKAFLKKHAEDGSVSMPVKPNGIDEYIAAQPEGVRPLLQNIRETIRAAAPEATEKISWRMPTFWQGENLIHFAAFKKHIGLYPGGEATSVFAERLADYKTSKGAIQLPLGKSIDYELVTDIVRWRVKQQAKSEPNAE